MKKIIYAIFTLFIVNITGCKDEYKESSFEKDIPIVRSNTIYFLGSSTIEYFTPSLKMWPEKYQLNTINLGKGGELIDTMCIRIGALPAHATFSKNKIKINEKNYFKADWGIDNSLKPFEARIVDIDGIIGVDTEGYYFESQQEAYIDINQAYPIKSLQKLIPDSIFILNLGKNNLLNLSHGQDSYNYVFDKTKQCAEWINKNITSRTIVVGHFTAVNANDDLSSNIQALNKDLKLYYSSNFFDLNYLLSDRNIWQNLQITPTTSDYEAQVKGDLAVSLSSDSIHLNNKTNQFITDQIYKTMIEKKWIN
ncbi:hypothetical protein AMD27_01855 [Acinetobacter sp. TGL-Y2]|uniref:hypothetical protein n=1 Tax=Acinetobacter sp. TGL-Y2 TaxID=1407071 RepID=UPI0007A6528C|nr:hypothetical protein [Acinetobacter sp. TGL-Y2]AMW77758.1 hypothetical protein AMD27_01855 [Acinetobacter sp. TGL-Y2]